MPNYAPQVLHNKIKLKLKVDKIKEEWKVEKSKEEVSSLLSLQHNKNPYCKLEDHLSQLEREY